MARALLGVLLALTCVFFADGTSVRAGSPPIMVTSSASAGPGTLRAAIDSANSVDGSDIIKFESAEFPPGNPTIISVDIELPEVDDTDGITIDGTGAGVIIDGSGADDVDGLRFDSPTDDSGPIILKSFTIRSFQDRPLVIVNDGHVDSLEVTDVESVLNGGVGLEVSSGSAGPVSINGSVFSGNAEGGVFISPDATLGPTTILQTEANGNTLNGISIFPGEAANDILIQDVEVSQNGQFGVEIGGDSMSNITIMDAAITQNGLAGLLVTTSGAINGFEMTGSSVSQNTGAGLAVNASGGASNVTITDNDLRANQRGLQVLAPGQGTNLVSLNAITGNTFDGVYLADGEGWTISANIMEGNGQLGIDLLKAGDTGPGVTANDIGDGDLGPNTVLNFPEWGIPGGYTTAVGTACAGCLVEVFKSDGDPSGFGEGEEFLGSATVSNAGTFQFPLCGLDEGDLIAATATDEDGNTSEFGPNYEVLEDEPPCGFIVGDLDCDGEVDDRDALIAFIHEAGATQLDREEGCPALSEDLGEPEPPAFGPTVFGDATCNNVADSGDGISILRYIAEAEPPPNECAPIGASYPLAD